VKNFSFRGCIRRLMGSHPGPAVPPYAARRRFARKLSVHQQTMRGEEEHPLPSTFNI